jgi:DNA-binding NarL/FixJ family response regulator
MQKQTISHQRSTSSRGTDAQKARLTNEPKRRANNGKSAPTPPTTPLTSPLIKAKVLIVHNVALTRFGLVRLIEPTRRFQICAETNDAPMARELFARHQPEIVVLGFTLRGGDGIELIKDFRKLNPAACTVVLSARKDEFSIQRALRAGACGYLLDEDDIPEILMALDEVSSGNLYTSPSVARRLLESLAIGAIEPVRSELKILSDRELEVFSLIGRGFGVTRLASELHLSVKTVETYQTRIKEKLGLRSAAELSEKATRRMVQSIRQNLRLRKKVLSKGDGSARQLICSY